MLQEIITYIILFATLVIAGYKVYQSFAKQKTACDDCSSSCNSCAVSELKQEIIENQKKKLKL
ncbi:MAG: hypothetical protein NTZ33_05015 [Bacteroidetes bacterium]|nr:hypothetical protein [Bacteroidota bacterium]